MNTMNGTKNDGRPDWKSVSCKIHAGTPGPNGYGVVGRVLAHRKAWSDEYGQIPVGMVIAHYCDMRLCVEPLHLWVGTQADNLRDMWEKGRGRAGGGGSKHTGFGALQSEAQKTTRMRECECGMKTNAGSMGRHLKASGHVLRTA